MNHNGEQLFEIKVDATGEVRDADGNLVSTEPISATFDLTRTELESLGLPVPSHSEEEK